MKPLFIFFAGLVACALACAQDVPGIGPPSDQLFFPTGLVCIPGNTTCDYLAIASSNFDQRYNAAVLGLYSVDTLEKMAPTPSSTSAIDLIANYGNAQVSHIRVPQFAGELAFLSDLGQNPPNLILQPTRGNNSVTAVAVNNGKLDCASAGGTAIPALDCTQPYVIPTHSLDPYTLAPATMPDGRTLMAIGHLRGEASPDPTPVITLKLNLIDLGLFRSRIQRHDTTIDPVIVTAEANIPGATGVVFSPAAAIGSPNGSFLISQRLPAAGVPVTLSSFDLYTDSMNNPVLGTGAAISLGTLASINELRGVALSGDGKRAYVTARFMGVGTTYQSAICVVGVDTIPFRLFSVFTVGEELEHPYVRERMIDGALQRLLYIPDIRRNTIFVVDVSRESPSIAGEIVGARIRIINNQQVIARMLDAPAAIAFAEGRSDGRSLAFVTNFANDTLAVLDISDADPRRHRIIARFGTVLYADGSGETP